MAPVAKLTPKVRSAVQSERMDRESFVRLTASQAEALASVALGDVESRDTSPVRALRALARSAKPEVAVPTLAEVLGRPAGDVNARVVAASELGAISSPLGERALLRAASDADVRVRDSAIRSLGVFAGKSALERLDVETTDAATRRELALARALIAHREGIPGFTLDPVEGRVVTAADVGQQSTLRFSLVPVKQSAALRGRLVGPTYGIPLGDRAAELTCGAREWTVFFHAALTPDAIAGRLGDRPWLAGILARRQLGGRQAVPQQLILTRPAGDRIRVDIARLDGTVLYTGTASATGDELAFTVSAVERPGVAPTTIVGSIGSAGIVVKSVVAAARRLPASTTAPVAFD